MLTVKFPEGITTFGNYMFYENSTIIEIELPNSLETIAGKETFIKATSLKKVNIPASLTAIPNKAFNSCTALEDVDFSKCTSLKNIGEYAFQNCDVLESITLLEGLTTIGACAFFGCDKLNYVLIPSTVDSVGIKAFETCAAIETIVCKASVLGERMFYQCNKVNTLTLENTVTIGAEALYQCGPKGATTGTTLVFPETLTTIGANAFTYLYFETITLPKTLTSVNSTAFTTGNYLKKILFTGTEEQASTLIGTAKTYELVNHCYVYYEGVHTFDTATYTFTSFVESAYLDGDCSKCGESGSRTEVAPIFYDFLYSAKIETEDNTDRAVVFTYCINREALATYNKYNESTVSFGIVAAFESKLTTDSVVANPLNQDGTTASAGVISMDLTSKDIVAIDFVIRGTQEKWEANDIPTSPLYMLGYVIVGDNLYYIGNNTEKASAQGANVTDLKAITYNELFTE